MVNRPRPHSLLFLLFCSCLLACGPPSAHEANVDDEQAPIFVGKADGGHDPPSADVAAGVLAFVNDPGVSVALLDASVGQGGVGLYRRAAENIPKARPYASLAELDAVPYVGPRSYEALRHFACEVRGLCEPELTLATWNLQQFPMAPGTVSAVAKQLEVLDADVVAIQEVADADAFYQLLELLPNHEGVLAEPGWYTGVGLVFRASKVQPLEVESLFVDDSRAFPRPALRVQAKVGARTMTFIVVHLKAQIDAESQARRRAACERLDAFIDARPQREIVVLGDWNDRITDVGAANVFEAFLSDPREYLFLTASLADEGAFSYVAFRSLIDHILVTDEVLAGRKPATSWVARLDLSLPDYRQVISDHLPVLSTLSVR